MKPFATERLSRLQATADVAIWRSHCDVLLLPSRRATSTTIREEDYVAGFILQGLPMLAASWAPLLQQWGMSLTLTGVFCHQTPKAKFSMNGSSVSPELADLLIVRRHVDSAHNVRQCAVLVQAKMTTDGEITLGSGDAQLHLYTTWPSFELIGYKAPKVMFCVGQDSRQALYAGITKGSTPNIPTNTGWAGFCPWAMMPPRQSGWVEDPLSLYLLKLLNFEVGREFFDPTITGCHWSELVHYLLKTTFALPLRTTNVGGTPDDPRGGSFTFNRMGFMSSTPTHASVYVPAARADELAGGVSDIPPGTSQHQFDDGGSGRVVTIETWETHEPGR